MNSSYCMYCCSKVIILNAGILLDSVGFWPESVEEWEVLDYICIDKACRVLRTAISNGSWDRIWKKTTRFIVDSYHYINHRTDDYLCRKWCNPAPLNGSAPNLVIATTDNQGRVHYKRAFNTQVGVIRIKLSKDYS